MCEIIPQAGNGWYIVRPAAFTSEMESGLVIPDKAKGKSWYGMVVASPDARPTHAGLEACEDLTGKMVYFNRPAAMEFMRPIDERGRPVAKAEPLLSVHADTILASWDVKPEDVDHAMQVPGMAIDHDMEKDMRNRIQGGV